MDSDEFEARLKAARRETAREIMEIETAMTGLAKLVRGKADHADCEQISIKLSGVESDMGDKIKSLRSDIQDLRHQMTRSTDALASSISSLSDSFLAFRREADGRTIDIVAKALAERKPMHPVVPAAGGGLLVSVILSLLYAMGAIPAVPGAP